MENSIKNASLCARFTCYFYHNNVKKKCQIINPYYQNISQVSLKGVLLIVLRRIHFYFVNIGQERDIVPNSSVLLNSSIESKMVNFSVS